MKNTFLLFLLILNFNALSQKKVNSILLEHGFLHVGNGQIIESALIGIKNGKIILVKNSLAYSYKKEDWDTIIDLKGKQIYPGFVAPNSTLGLTEIDAIRATNDFKEVGELNPHVRSQIAYNLDSKVISTVRTNGILLAQPCPRGGVITGTSSILYTDGWNWEDATVLKDDGVHVNWPNPFEYKGKKNEDYAIQKMKIDDFFNSSSIYSKLEDVSKPDLRFEAMKDCFQGTKRVYFHADHIQQILDIIDFSKKYNIKFPVIIGGYDSYLVTQKLKDSKIPIMLLRTHSLPVNDEDPIDLPYRLPFLLQKAGIKFCLQNEGDMEAMNARNLPFLAGTGMAYGLTEEEAIRSITLSSCEIIGISNLMGSVEEGKNATLFVSSGNALDMKTNQLIVAIVNGKFMSLENSQTELYEKYEEKYKK